MEGYGVYYKEKIVAWFAEAENADGFRMAHRYDSCSYTIKPTSIGILTDLKVTLDNVTSEVAGVKAPQRKPCDLSEVLISNLKKPYVSLTSKDPITEEDLAGLNRILNIKQDKMEELKTGHCGKICNGCDYSTPSGDCIMTFESEKQDTSEAYNDSKDGDTNTIEEPLPYKTREEWLSNNPLKELMVQSSLGYVELSNDMNGFITPMRLQKLVLGLEEPKDCEYGYILKRALLMNL